MRQLFINDSFIIKPFCNLQSNMLSIVKNETNIVKRYLQEF